MEKLLHDRTKDDPCVKIELEPPRDLQTAVLMATKAILLDLPEKVLTTCCERLKLLLEQEGLLPEARSLQDFICQLLGIPQDPTQDLSDNLGWDFVADKPDTPAIYMKGSLEIEGSLLENIQSGLERLAVIYPMLTFRILMKGGGQLIFSCNYYPKTE
ncbi:hypothetical protein CIHG_09841 [Coccidioides immitis H538.4]|uniref:Uncharacterized protein n=1 Tax=Coccidioides immitis H538.4 TaxID=396776 RepID=A0A0J8UVW1_COCIT|nr:hypothetical protein CIHG_09841 [Coccidioides immitis H538.4]